MVKMNSKRSMDSYSKTRALRDRSVERRGNRLGSATSKIDTRRFDSKEKFTKSTVKTPRTNKKIEINSSRSELVSPPSPVLSPETSAVLENAEKIIQDVQLQIKELSTVKTRQYAKGDCHLHVREPSFDDENDQLLYLRERVASKFHDIDKGIDMMLEIKRGRNYGGIPAKFSTSADSLAPKFHTPEMNVKCLQNYGKSREHAFTSTSKNSKNVNPSDLQSSTGHNAADASVRKRLEKFTVQSGPSVNIECELQTEKLQGVHISPDPSFIQEISNTGTYRFQHQSVPVNSSPKYQKKFAKIVESNVIVEETDNQQQRETQLLIDTDKRNTDKRNTDKRNTDSSTVATNDLLESQVLTQKKTSDANNKSSTGYSKEEKCKEKLANEVVFLQESDAKKLDENAEMKKQDTKTHNLSTQNGLSSMKIHNHVLDDIINKPLPTDVDTKDTKTPEFSSTDTQKSLEDHYKTIETNFENLLKTYSKKRVSFRYRESSSTLSDTSLEDGLHNVDRINLYHPSVTELDILMAEYDKALGGIIQGVNMVEKFLSHKKLAEYCGTNSKPSSDGSKDQRQIPKSVALNELNRKQLKVRNKPLQVSNRKEKIERHNFVGKVSQSGKSRATETKENYLFNKGIYKNSRAVLRSEPEHTVDEVEHEKLSYNQCDLSSEHILSSETQESQSLSTSSSSSSSEEMKIRRTLTTKAEGKNCAPISIINAHFKNLILVDEYKKVKENADFPEILYNTDKFSHLTKHGRKLQKSLKAINSLDICSKSQLKEKELNCEEKQNVQEVIQDVQEITENVQASTAELVSVNITNSKTDENVFSEHKEDASQRTTQLSLNQDNQPPEVDGVSSKEYSVNKEINNEKQSSSSEKLNSKEDTNDTSPLSQNSNHISLPIYESSRIDSKLGKITCSDVASLGQISIIKKNDEISKENDAIIEKKATDILEPAPNSEETTKLENTLDSWSDASNLLSNEVDTIEPEKDVSKGLRLESHDTVNKDLVIDPSLKHKSSSSSLSSKKSITLKKGPDINTTAALLKIPHGSKENGVQNIECNIDKEQSSLLASITDPKISKHKTLSDTSHSEGELYVTSSCSYSLGEVRIPKVTDITDSTVKCNDNINVIVTRSMLSSWNESSDSMVESLGEI